MNHCLDDSQDTHCTKLVCDHWMGSFQRTSDTNVVNEILSEVVKLIGKIPTFPTPLTTVTKPCVTFDVSQLSFVTSHIIVAIYICLFCIILRCILFFDMFFTNRKKSQHTFTIVAIISILFLAGQVVICHR